MEEKMCIGRSCISFHVGGFLASASPAAAGGGEDAGGGGGSVLPSS